MEKVYRYVNGELVEIPQRDPARLYRYTLVNGETAYVELTPAEEATRLFEQNAPQFSPSNWYWLVPGQSGVYHSARFAYVPLADSAYVAFLAAGGAAYTGLAEAELRDYLNFNGIAYLGEAVPPLEIARPSVPRARVRLQRASFGLANNTATAVPFTAAGQDPLDMHDHTTANRDQIVIPAGQGGLYVLTAGFRFLESSAAAGGVANAGDRLGGIRRGVAAGEILVQARVRASAADNTEFQVYDEVLLAPGDILRVGALQSCGGTMNVATRFTLRRLE